MRKLFPPAVWATAFAALIAFMGIGLVDPLLPLIGEKMGVTPFQVEWLFTSYIAVMAVTMLLSGVLATQFGSRRVLLIGLLLVVVFASLSGLAPNIWFLAIVRAGWGLGNAFFTSTALSIIVGNSKGSMATAITLYEAALGLGIASGPLLGGFLGNILWRLPFFGTAFLMLFGFIFTFVWVKEPPNKEPPRKARDIFRALRHPAVLSNAVIGMAYSFAFFTILAYSPVSLEPFHISTIDLGFTYFAWGILVGISSVFVVNWLRPVLGPINLVLVNLICMVGIFVAAALVPGLNLLWVIVISGLFCGIANAMFTTLAMEVSPFSRSISSGAYNFLRWAGAAVAPVISGWLDIAFGVRVPFWVCVVILVLGSLAVLVLRPMLQRGLDDNGEAGLSHAH